MPAPAPKAAAAVPSTPAPAPKAAVPTTPAPARTAAGTASSPKKAAAAGGTLPHTGPHSARLLLLLAGIAFATGGLSVVGGARRAGS
jgi:LPXTG-motif cell wall-anchored protein